MLRLFGVLKPFRYAIAAIVALTFLQTLANLYLPTLMSDLVDIGIVRGNLPYIYEIGALMLGIAAVGAGFSIAGGYLAARTAAAFGKIVRAQVFAHVESFSLAGFDQIGTASLIVRTTDDIMHVQQALTMMLRMMIMAPMSAIGGIIMAVAKNARLSLVFVVVLPLLTLAIVLISRRSAPLFRSLQAKLDTLNRVVRERLAGMRVIRAFDRVEHEHRRFEAANEDLTGTAIRANRLMAVMMPLMMLVMNLTIVAIVWFGSRLIAAERLEVGDLMAFIQYAMQIMFSLLMVSMLFAMIPRAAVSAGRINEVLDTAPTIVDRPAPQAAANAPSGTESEPPGIAFAGVRFGYPGAAEPVLSDVSFRAPRGRVTALIGGTGAGKSTIVNLIMRFYDVDAGRVCIDGVDVREWSQAALRAKIGLVPQKAVLFTGSVAENIRYGDEHASDDAVHHAAQIAQAAEFIDELPERYGAPVTQGGTNLSGGQRQRLAIARAIVRRPEIYVLDDCFSALDFRTDARLRAALRAETGNATVLIVAQRVSTVMHADQVIVLDEGRIAGIGTHRELLQSCAVYREIVASQLDEEEIA